MPFPEKAGRRVIFPHQQCFSTWGSHRRGHAKTNPDMTLVDNTARRNKGQTAIKRAWALFASAIQKRPWAAGRALFAAHLVKLAVHTASLPGEE